MFEIEMDKEQEQKPEQEWPPKRKLRTRREWESAVEKQIREAMERGDFDNLPGHGKPLDLSFDPNVPADWQLAFKILKDAGYAPDWIELDKEIRAAQEKLFAPFERYLQHPYGNQVTRAAREEYLIAQFRKQAVDLNRTIDLFNLKAPSPRVHRPRIRIEEAIQKFRDGCAQIT